MKSITKIILLFFLLINFYSKSYSESLVEKNSYVKYSCWEEGEYQLKINDSKKYFNFLKKIKAYALIINELTSLSYCYENLKKDNEFVLLIHELMDEEIISKNIFLYEGIKEEQIKSLFYRYRVKTNPDTHKEYTVKDWSYKKRFFNIFLDNQIYYEEFYEAFFFQQYFGWKNKIIINEYEEIIKQLIQKTKKNELPNYYLKFSESYVRFNKILNNDKCINYFIDTIENNSDLILIPNEIESLEGFFSDGIHCISSGNIDFFLSPKAKRFLKTNSKFINELLFVIKESEKIYNLEKVAEANAIGKKIDSGELSISDANDYFQSPNYKSEYDIRAGMNSIVYLKDRILASVIFISAFSGVMGDEENKKLYQEIYSEKNKLFFSEHYRYIYLEKYRSEIEWLTSKGQYELAEKEILLALDEINNFTKKDYIKGGWYEYNEDEISDKMVVYEINKLKNNYLLVYSNILDFTGRYSESIDLKKKIISQIKVTFTDNTFDLLTKEAQLNSKDFQYTLPSLYLSIIKTLILFNDQKEIEYYFSEIDELCKLITGIMCEVAEEKKFEYYVSLREKKYFEKVKRLYPKMINDQNKAIAQAITEDQKKVYKVDRLAMTQKYYRMAVELNIDGKEKYYRKKECEAGEELSSIIFDNQELFYRDQIFGSVLITAGCMIAMNEEITNEDEENYFKSVNNFLNDYQKDLIKWSKFGYLDKKGTTTNWGFQLAAILAKSDEEFSNESVKKYSFLNEKVFKIIQLESGNYKIKSQKKIINSYKDEKLYKLIKERDVLEAKLSNLIKNTLSNPEQSNINFSKNKSIIEEKILNIDNKIQSKYKDWINVKKFKTYDFSDIQKKLDEDEAFIYISNQNFLLIYTITKNNIKIDSSFNTSSKQNLFVDSINSMRISISNFNPKNYAGTLDFFYRYIFEQYIEKNLTSINKINVISDKYFSALPFELLITNGDRDDNNKFIQKENNDYKYLIQKYNFSYFPSISSFVELESKNKILTANSSFLGIGNPKFAKINANDSEKLNRVEKIFLNNRGFINNSRKINERYTEIPFTEKELKAISPLFNFSKLLLGNNANEENIKKLDLKKYDVISFATHAEVAGEFDDFNEPFLVMTPPETGSEINDGLITASEISELDLNTKLIILSACNTASKENKYSEGFTGLINSFFIAGTDSVIATHWPVEDKAGYLLMSETLKKIINNNFSTSEALRETKLEFIDGKYGEEFKKPFYWAPYILIGN